MGDKLVKGLRAHSIIVSPAASRTVVVSTQSQGHFVSEDTGETWRKIGGPSGGGLLDKFMFHKSRPRYALVSFWGSSCFEKKVLGEREPCAHMLYITKDLGR